MKSPRRILCACLLLLLCPLLSCCGKKTEEEPFDDLLNSYGQPDGSLSEYAPDPLDALLRCVKATEEAASFSAVLEGSCSTQVLFISYTQQVHSERTVTADAMFSQNVSVSSLVRVGVQQYFQGDTVLIRSGDVQSIDSVSWEDDATSVTPEAYRAAYGNTPRSLSNYLITAETVLSVQLATASDDEIVVICELDPVKSTGEYAKQVKTTGGLDDLPVFSSVALAVTMDSAYHPIRVEYRETYDISIAVLGNTTCKTEYVETFSDFNAVTSVPEQAFFDSFLYLPPTEYPDISSGYTLLSALFGESASYDVTLEAGGRTLPMQLSLDTVSGSILLHGETVDLLYDGDRYYLLSGDHRLSAGAEELNQRFLPLAEQLLSPEEQVQGGEVSSLFSDLRTQTENGNLLLLAGNEKDFFHATVDPRSFSLLSAELCLSGSDTPFRLLVKKTDAAPPLPLLTDCTDLTPSLSALSFLDVLPAVLEGETLSARLQVEGSSIYAASLALSLRDGLRFSVLPAPDALPLSVYGQGEALTAVWENLSITGTYQELLDLLALFSGTQISSAPTADLSAPRLKAEPDKLIFRFDNGFSLTLAGSVVRLSGNGLSARISIHGTSARKVSTAPKAETRLSAAELASFLTDSVYPALLRSDAVAGDLKLTYGGEDTRFRMRARLHDALSLGLTTVRNGEETDLLYADGTLFLFHPVFDAFLPLERLSAFDDSLTAPFQALSGAMFDGTESFTVASVSCDGERLTFTVGDTTVTLEKDRLTVSGEDWEAVVTGLTPIDPQNLFTPPDRSACIDLAALAERVTPLLAQKTFAFTGRYEGESFSAELSRLSLSLKENGEVAGVAVNFLPDGASDPVRLFYDGGCLFLEIGETRLFCLADELLSDGMLQTLSGNEMRPENLLAIVKNVTFRNNILEVETADARIRLTWDGNALSDVFYSSGESVLSLHSVPFAPTQTPPLEKYTDITPLAGLLQPLIATAESGSFAFDGTIDLQAFSLSLTDIRVSGAFRFSDTGAEGAVTVVLPYLPGLTSDGVPLRQGNRLLTDCSMCSELFLSDGKLYLRRTVDAFYGALQPIPYTATEAGYLTLEEALADPLRVLRFLLRLEPSVIAGNGTVAGNTSGGVTGSPLKRFSHAGNRYTLELNPEIVLPVSDRILLFAETDGGYVTGVGAEVQISSLSVVASGTLLAHGGVDLSPVLRQDFSGYAHLHN